MDLLEYELRKRLYNYLKSPRPPSPPVFQTVLEIAGTSGTGGLMPFPPNPHRVLAQ